MIPAKEFDGELWIRAADIHLLTKDKKRTWIGLTDEEELQLASLMSKSRHWLVAAVADKLKQKNDYAEEKNA